MKVRPITEAQLGYLRLQYRYDAITGRLFRVSAPDPSKSVGCDNGQGYLAVFAHLGGNTRRTMLVHRIAWALHSGVYPTGGLDHINGDRSDNRISNLREVSQALNSLNRHKKVGKNQHLPIGICIVPHYGNGKTFSYLANIRLGKRKFRKCTKSLSAARRFLKDSRQQLLNASCS